MKQESCLHSRIWCFCSCSGEGGCNDQVASIKVQMRPCREESGWYSTLKIDGGFLVFQGSTFPSRELGAWV